MNTTASSVARSRLFRVTDANALRNALANTPIEMETVNVEGNEHVFLFTNEGRWPDASYLDAEGKLMADDLLHLIQPYLPEGEVAVLETISMPSGLELTTTLQAINREGQIATRKLDHLTGDLVKELGGRAMNGNDPSDYLQLNTSPSTRRLNPQGQVQPDKEARPLTQPGGVPLNPQEVDRNKIEQLGDTLH